MPLYEYKCDKCGSLFEVIQKFSDEPLSTHDQCGGAVERQISAPALQFKGSGWYITDYAKSGSGAGKSDSSSSTPSGKTGGDSSSSGGATSTPAASSPSTPAKSSTGESK